MILSKISSLLSLVVAGLATVATVASCVPPAPESFDGIVINLNDTTTQRIYGFQNTRRADSLVNYLHDDEPNYRYLAARGLASFPEISSTAVAALGGALKDRSELVRTAAAHALGQTGASTAADLLTAAFDTEGTMIDYNAEVLAAIGKTGRERALQQLAGISTYTNQDTVLQVGRLRGIFYFARRGITSEPTDSLIVARLLDTDAPEPVRREAAFYLQRFPVSLTTAHHGGLRELLRNETDPILLMGIARALGNHGDATGRVALLRKVKTERDWRVRVEILQALKSFDYESVRTTIFKLLADDHPLVRQQAADFLLTNGSGDDAGDYVELAGESTKGGYVGTTLYAAANRHLPKARTDQREQVNFTLLQSYQETEDVYRRGAIIRALAAFPWNYKTIYGLYSDTDSPVVRSTAAEALYSINNLDGFDAYFRPGAATVRRELAGYFKKMITDLAVGPAFHAANALADTPQLYRPLFPDLMWLESALGAFNLPKDIEAYYAVDAARAALAGEQAPQPDPPTSTPPSIDWSLLEGGDQTVRFRTSVGQFTLRLFPDLAPATAANFLRLAHEGYYDGKAFHRVVPNFVAQGGGPLGDGFGSETYAIRTETPGVRWDRAGLVGMASAGKDTEGVQFFITHRPVPHLDGNYTIFGAVTEGQDIVDRITVGTVIETVTAR